jgi:hypothetical protein
LNHFYKNWGLGGRMRVHAAAAISGAARLGREGCHFCRPRARNFFRKMGPPGNFFAPHARAKYLAAAAATPPPH